MSAQFVRRCLFAVLGLAILAAPIAATPQSAVAQDGPGMPSFKSDAELIRFLKGTKPDDPWDDEGGAAIALPPPPPPPPAPPPPPPPPSPGAPASPPAMAARAAEAPPANDQITSTQVQGVDEGGIVKVIGDHLVILRRGRLFTVSVANGGLRPVDSINAFPPGVTGQGDWYDEMLVRGDMVVVVGYSYARGGTEVNRFRMAPDGKLSWLDAYHLRSSDYYSSENYASRIVGDQLVVYAPRYLNRTDDLEDMLPGVSRWAPGQEEPTFKRLAQAREVYIPAPLLRRRANTVEAMHTVTRCDLTAPELTCKGTAVLGPSGRTFFVSRNAIYVWVMPAWSWDDKAETFLYRIPLDGGRPTAVQTRGAPVNQFSFNANARDGMIEVLVTPRGGGDEMWAPEFAAGRPSLLRLPTSRFGDGSGVAPRSDYRWLPGEKNVRISANRFVGDHLLYGLDGYGMRGTRRMYDLVAVETRGGEPAVFNMEYPVDRIEQTGPDALVVGSAGATTFQAVELDPGQAPRLGDFFRQPDSREAESRSHAFFYNPTSADGRDGIAGLPVLRLSGQQWLTDMLFLRRAERKLGEFGVLSSSPDKGPAMNDGCTASCVDWYGNARPIFLRGRVFALLGYEIVEGDASGARIREVRRVDYSPRAGR